MARCGCYVALVRVKLFLGRMDNTYKQAVQREQALPGALLRPHMCRPIHQSNIDQRDSVAHENKQLCLSLQKCA